MIRNFIREYTPKQEQAFLEDIKELRKSLKIIQDILLVKFGAPPIDDRLIEKLTEEIPPLSKDYPPVIMDPVETLTEKTIDFYELTGRYMRDGFLVNIGSYPLYMQYTPDGINWTAKMSMDPGEQIVFADDYKIHSIKISIDSGIARIKLWLR